jgi:hypothetical protein
VEEGPRNGKHMQNLALDEALDKRNSKVVNNFSHSEDDIYSLLHQGLRTKS